MIITTPPMMMNNKTEEHNDYTWVAKARSLAEAGREEGRSDEPQYYQANPSPDKAAEQEFRTFI